MISPGLPSWESNALAYSFTANPGNLSVDGLPKFPPPYTESRGMVISCRELKRPESVNCWAGSLGSEDMSARLQ